MNLVSGTSRDFSVYFLVSTLTTHLDPQDRFSLGIPGCSGTHLKTRLALTQEICLPLPLQCWDQSPISPHLAYFILDLYMYGVCVYMLACMFMCMYECGLVHVVVFMWRSESYVWCWPSPSTRVVHHCTWQAYWPMSFWEFSCSPVSLQKCYVYRCVLQLCTTIMFFMWIQVCTLTQQAL